MSKRYSFPLTRALLAKFEAQAHYEEAASDPLTPYAALAVTRGNFIAACDYLREVEDAREGVDGYQEYIAAYEV